jgi:hypothetical protein
VEATEEEEEEEEEEEDSASREINSIYEFYQKSHEY